MRTKIIFLLFFSLMGASIYAQKSDNSTPKSIELKLNDDKTLSSTKKIFSPLNIKALQVEDENDELNGLPPRFGYPIDVNINLANSGYWKEMSNGDRIWRLEIECKDAISINLLYDKFWLPNEAKLHIYAKNKSQIIGGFSSENNRGTRLKPSKFTTGLIFSQSIIIELYEPLTVKNKSIISVDKVVHGYREIDLKGMITNEAGHGDSGPCQVNVNCSEGQNWKNEKKGIAMILVGGTRWCSGSLVNNTSNDYKPYFLTADHCLNGLDAYGNTDASYYSFWWNYESSVCSPNSTDFVASSTSGATLVANNPTSDFALFELNESPLDNNIDVYFNGWDRTTNPSQSGVGIHHPNGDFKKIATHTVIPSPGQIWGSNTHWRVNWLQTTNGFSVTENGSSGSPLFTNDKRIIGQLHGGGAINCSDPANDPAEYGRFHVSWNGSSPQRRLRDWLDPSNTNQTFLNGINPNPPMSLTGSNIVCGSNTSFNLQNGGSNVTWQVSSNLLIVSSNNNSITVKAKTTSVYGSGFIRAILPYETLQKDVWVGKPLASNISIWNSTQTSYPYDTTPTGTPIEFVVGYPPTNRCDILDVEWEVSYGTYIMNGSFPCFGSNYTTNKLIVFTEPGTQYVRVRIRNNCGWSDWKTISIYVTQGYGGYYRIYPNPTSEILNITKLVQNNISHEIDLQKNMSSNIETYELYDFNSKLILKGKLSNQNSIDTSKYKKGIYFLKIISKNNIETHQIIIN